MTSKPHLNIIRDGEKEIIEVPSLPDLQDRDVLYAHASGRDFIQLFRTWAYGLGSLIRRSGPTSVTVDTVNIHDGRIEVEANGYLHLGMNTGPNYYLTQGVMADHDEKMYQQLDADLRKAQNRAELVLGRALVS
ncbi:MAG: hypothetical protein ABH864_00740 [archaeon]